MPYLGVAESTGLDNTARSCRGGENLSYYPEFLSALWEGMRVGTLTPRDSEAFSMEF